MSVLEKLKIVQQNLNWNIVAKSYDILPLINECIDELEEEVEKPVSIVPKMKIDDGEVLEIVHNPIEDLPMEELEYGINKTTVERAMEYLKNKKCKGLNYKSDDKLIERAIREGFTI